MVRNLTKLIFLLLFEYSIKVRVLRDSDAEGSDRHNFVLIGFHSLYVKNIKKSILFLNLICNKIFLNQLVLL